MSHAATKSEGTEKVIHNLKDEVRLDAEHNAIDLAESSKPVLERGTPTSTS